MPQPELPSDVQAVRELQAELTNRGITLPKSLMPLDEQERTMFRFLRARKMNATAAADMLQNTLKWRQEYKVEESLETFLPDDKDNKLRQFLPSGFVGFDKAGSPVWMEHAAAIDVPGMEAAGITLEDFVYYHVRAMEYMVNCKYSEATTKAGHPVDSHCVILDLAGLRLNMLNQNTIKVFKSMAGVYQDHYPELMSRMFLVNIPLMFAAVWKVLQMFVDDRVKAKIRFLRKADFHILHEFVDRDQLPESLGGKSKEKLLSDKQGYLPASLLDVNAEVQRRINARKAKESQPQQQAEQKEDKPLRLSTPDTAEPPISTASADPAPSTPVVFNADESMPPVSFDPMQHSATTPAVFTPAGSSAQSPGSPGLSDFAPSPSGQTQHSASHAQDGLRHSDLHSGSSSQQQQQQQQSAGVRQTDAGEPAVQQAAAVTGVPARLLAQVDSEAAAGQAGATGKQHRSKRERARGLLSSFTTGRRKPEESQQAVDQAMQMLAELRRTESSPNVEAEALKRNKGGGGPWMSFTRQRRPRKPRSGKKGGEGGSPGGARRGSPLATVVSIDANTMADAADAAVGGGPRQNGAADKHSHHKGWNPFCAKAPLVQDDDSEGMIDSRQLKAHGEVPPGGFPPSASSATLKQRLSKKLSAIPAYLQTSEDPDSLRLASAEPSSSSLSGSSLSSMMFQNDVVGRYASAPDLQALAADPAARRAPQPLSPYPTPAKAPPPGSETSLAHSQATSPSASWKDTRSGSNLSTAGQPTLGVSAGAQAVNKADQQYVQTVILQHERATALQRRGRRCGKMLARNWMFVLFAVLNATGIWLLAGSSTPLNSQ